MRWAPVSKPWRANANDSWPFFLFSRSPYSQATDGFNSTQKKTIQEYQTQVALIRPHLGTKTVLVAPPSASLIVRYKFPEMTRGDYLSVHSVGQLDARRFSTKQVVLLAGSWMQQPLVAKLRTKLKNVGEEAIITKSGPIVCYRYQPAEAKATQVR